MIEIYFAPASVAVLFARIILGILFFFQGYEKIFKIKIHNVIIAIAPSYKKLKFPDFLVSLTAYTTSFIELIGGFLLIAGLFRYEAYYLLGIDLLIVSIGFSLINSMWDMQYILPRLLLLILLLLLPTELDIYSIDSLIGCRS